MDYTMLFQSAIHFVSENDMILIETVVGIVSEGFHLRIVFTLLFMLVRVRFYAKM